MHRTLRPRVWLWQDSLMPDGYSVMDIGYADHGGRPVGSVMASGGHGHHAMAGRSVTALTADPAALPTSRSR